MLIDWFTVAAQTVNFLILVWLMRRFLYRPILSAIDLREKNIAKEITDANEKEREAQNEKDEFKRKNNEFDEQRAALLTKATVDAGLVGQRLLEEARKTTDELKAKHLETLRSDAAHLRQSMIRQIQQEVFAITRKVLADMATSSLEERMTDIFIRRLRELDATKKETLVNTFRSAPDSVVISSTFEIPELDRALIQKALNEMFSAAVGIKYATANELVCGIALTTNGQKTAWTISDYLESMQKHLDEFLDKQAKSTPPVTLPPVVPISQAPPRSPATPTPHVVAQTESVHAAAGSKPSDKK